MPATRRRLEAFRDRTRARIASGELVCPDAGRYCSSRHTRECLLGSAELELERIERELAANAIAGAHFAPALRGQ